MRNPEIWLALIILGFLLFGAKKMPDAARGLGRSLRIFKAEMKGMGEDEQAQQAPQPQAQPAAPAQLTAPAPVISAPPAAPVGAQQPVAPVGAQQPPAQQPESH